LWEGRRRRIIASAVGFRRLTSLAALAAFAASVASAQEPRPSPAATIPLAEAVKLAMEQNPDALDAGDSLVLAQARRSAARAEFRPQLTPGLQRSDTVSAFVLSGAQKLPWTGGSLAVTGSLRRFEEAEGPLSRTSNFGVTLSQPLLRGAGPTIAHAGLYTSRRALEERERSLVLARQRVAREVARSFYQVVLQRQLLKVGQQSLQRSRDLLRASEARLEAGLVSKLDVYRAELQAAEAEETALGSESALQTALEGFRVTLGLSTQDPVEPAEVDAAALEPGPDVPTSADLDRLVAVALERRLDLQETRDKVADAGRSAKIARQELWPSLNLNLAFNHYGVGPSLGSALHPSDRRFEAFVSTSYPLDRSTAKVSATAAQLAEGAAQRAVLQQQRIVEGQVREAVRDLDRLRRSLALQKRSVEVTEQQLRLATLRYQRGLASNFDVVDAERGLVLARSTLMGLLTSFQLAVVDLRRATGELDVEKDFAR
jgi:outer membrane protein